MKIKNKLEKTVWRSDVYYQMAQKGSLDTSHPGMVILKEVAEKSTRILDLGCGEGTRLSFLVNGKQGIGIDISQKGIELARKNYPNLKFRKADLESIPLKNESFDLVYSTFVLEHLTNPEKVLKEAIRLLKPKGHFVLIAPNYGAPNRCSPPFKGSRFSKLVKGILGDIVRSSNLNWNKVVPIAGESQYDVDWDTTVEPYISSLVSYLETHSLKIIKATSCWSQELPNAKPHQKLFRFLDKLHLYPFTYWGPHLVILAQKQTPS